MGLAQQQRALAMLLTRPPAGEVPEIGEMERARRSLVAKRMLEVAALLPRTRATLGERFVPAFRSHALAYQPRGLHKVADDAIAFAARFPRVAAARYERAALMAQRAGASLRIIALNTHPYKSKRFALACWWRPRRNGRLRHWVFF